MNIRAIYIPASALASAYIGFQWGSMLNGADAVLGGIVDVFSILAGVLVAVISIIGDPSMLLPGSWRAGFEHAKEIQNKLARFSHLFSAYMITIFVVLISRLVDSSNIESMYWIFSVVLGLVSFCVLMSIPLPYSLMAIQKERMREEIRRRKERAS